MEGISGGELSAFGLPQRAKPDPAGGSIVCQALLRYLPSVVASEGSEAELNTEYPPCQILFLIIFNYLFELRAVVTYRLFQPEQDTQMTKKIGMAIDPDFSIEEMRASSEKRKQTEPNPKYISLKDFCRSEQVRINARTRTFKEMSLKTVAFCKHTGYRYLNVPDGKTSTEYVFPKEAIEAWVQTLEDQS